MATDITTPVEGPGNGGGALSQDDGARLSLLYDVCRALNQTIELGQLIAVVVAKTKEVLDAESSAILLYDEERDQLYFPYSADADPGVAERLSHIRLPADQGVCGWVMRRGIAQVVPDVTRDPRWYAQVDKESGAQTRSLLCAPLRTQRGTLGVIELRNKVHGEFTPDDLEFLDALAGNIAIALENARTYGAVKASEARLREEVALLNRELAGQSRFVDIIGSSQPMRRVFQLMESAVASPVTVLIEGETGTGKELIARAIHYNGARRDRSFVAVNCGALSETLLESELFGHRRGAFTGAIADKKGFFEVADGGTIFLDEVGEMSPAMQVKLLRVLQGGEIMPVGDTSPIRVNVRVIAATNRDLEAEVRRAGFREDLYYRLSTFPILVPPLRARTDDIPLLAAHLLQRTAERFGRQVNGFGKAAVKALTEYSWPGNVRELENEIERAVAIAGTADTIQLEHLSERVTKKKSVRVLVGAAATTLKRARETFEKEYVGEILRQKNGNVSQTAKVIGISRVMLTRKLRAWALRPVRRPPAR